jgi:hypothetical protein
MSDTKNHVSALENEADIKAAQAAQGPDKQ